MPTHRMTLMVHTDTADPNEVAAEFLAATENADVSFDIVETVEAEEAP